MPSPILPHPLPLTFTVEDPELIEAECPGHSASIASGSSTVKVNTKGCGRVGDGISGCTSVAQGSSNVFAG